MSRRSRRKRAAGKNPVFGKVVILIGALLVVGAGVGYLGVRAYLHSDSFRKFLSAQLGAKAKVEGEFSPFYWDGLAVETEGYTGTGEGLVSNVEISKIDTEIGFGGLSRGVWEVKSTRINRIEVALDTTKADEPAPIEPVIEKKKVARQQPGWVPKKLELESLEIGTVSVDLVTKDGPVTAEGMGVRVLPQKGENAYEAEIVGGQINLPKPWLPPLNLKRVSAVYRDGSAFLTKAEFGAWDKASVIAFGEWNFDSGLYGFEGEIDGVRCDEVLNENWAQRLSGDISTSYELSNHGGAMVVSGELGIRNGTLTALPVLDALAAYADTRRFRILQLNEARTKWRYSEDGIFLTDLAMGSEGLIRIEGDITIRGEKLDGTFRLGLVPGTLANIPGAETHVFKPGSHGLLWAPLRITGTIDNPQEDLTDRLIDAAGLRMFEKLPETGEQVLKFTTNALGETPGRVIEQGRKVFDEGGKVIEEGEKVIKGAGGIFRDIFGN